ncbi:UDP-N-acetylmuramate--L-alanine ligase [Elusimicrobiota bacterium]
MFKKIRHIHFIGIGGSGMSGIAEVLLNLGYKVSGSDVAKSDVTEHLKKLGAKVFIGHRAKNVIGSNVVVTSTAIKQNNTEVSMASKSRIPIIPRIEMLAELARLKYAVTIAGTHGKTTATSLVSLVLFEGGFDPTVIIGGKLKNLKSGAKLGKGDYIVAEADESDGSFLKLTPTITAVTNIDNDHLDYYGTLENIKHAFVRHINSIPFYGCAILCSDDKNILEIMPQIKRPYKTFGLKGKPHFLAKGIKPLDYGSSFSVYYRRKKLGKINLSISGKHNVQNALVAVAVGHELGMPFNKISKALNDYEGVGRRLEVKGKKKGVLVIDDYGHHPTEIKATIKAIKANWPNKRLKVLFQPHRYSRTAHLFAEFAKSFNFADQVKLLEIYPAGEKQIRGVSSQLIYNEMKKNKKNVSHFEGIEVFAKGVRKGDIILTIGAGDVWKIGEEILKRV